MAPTDSPCGGRGLPGNTAKARPPWDQIKAAAKTVTNEVQQGLQVAQTKVVELKQAAVQQYNNVSQNVVQTYQMVEQAVIPAVKNAGKVIVETPGKVANAAGIENISYMSNTRAPFVPVPVVDVKKDSPLDKALFFKRGPMTIYPIGVFINDPMSDFHKAEESYHWVDQATTGLGLPLWYVDYVFQYGLNYLAYGFNSDLAYRAISYEKEAKSYAAKETVIPYTPPPSIPEYWWGIYFGP